MKAKYLFFILLLLLWASTASAVSIAPEIVEQLKASGQLDEIIAADNAAREKGVWDANPDPVIFGVTEDIDTLHCLIVLVDFVDMPYTNGYQAEPEEFDTLLFSEGITNPGSMTDYYFETSYGQAYLVGQVTQWYRMPETYAYYVDGQRGFGTYPQNAQKLTEDAVIAADPDVDFAIFDNSGNGQVDALFIVHAGPGYEDTGNLNYIHSHAWVTSYHMPVDGVEVYRYSMEPEETGSGQLITIGVYCHEYGHVLGLPDLYDYDYDSNGVGMWSVMAGGSWGGGGATPVHFDAWCKSALGWVTPTFVYDWLEGEQIDAVEFEPDIYMLSAGGIPYMEYFLVENRRRMLFDVSLPGDGLLIYHVDENVPNNNNQNHYKVAVEQADGEFDLENNNGADNGDPWPGSTDNRTFDDFSIPNAWYYYNGPSEVSVANISDSDSTMYADLSVMYNEPLYELIDITFNDEAGNNNGRPEAGETVQLIFESMNVRAQVNDLIVYASCGDPAIIFSDSVSNMGTQPLNTPFDNTNDPMIFIVPDSYPVSFVDFELTFTADAGSFEQEIIYTTVVGMPDYLLVDDDGGLNEHEYFTTAMNNLALVYDVWDVNTAGSPATNLDDYAYVIWFTGDTRPETMSPENVDGLTSYLNNGGLLLITSQDIVQRLSERGDPADMLFLNSYLKVDYEMRETNHLVVGETGTLFEGLQVLTAGNGGAGNQISQDALLVQPGGAAQMLYGTDKVAAVSFVGFNYAAITFGFGIEGIHNDYPGYDTREDVLGAALSYLSNAVGIDDDINTPMVFELIQNYEL
jgi:immune inhibitor A